MSGPVETPGLLARARRVVLGPPRDLRDRSLFHRISLVPLLAWVGLGADGLSSSAYGPEEAFRALGEHTYLAIGLAGMTALTVFVIAAGYSRIIERFPLGGGGYVLATKLLGPRVGVVSGCALLVDYILTITISIAAAGAALFSFVPPEWHGWKVPTDVALIATLALLNLRGVRESVLMLAPIFVVFSVTHAIAIGGGLIGHFDRIQETVAEIRGGFAHGASTLGLGGMLLLFLHAYSLGGGSYTGLEAVSNGLPILREPRVQTGKRTMLYMAISLAVTAGGLLILYLLWDVRPVEGKTLNAVLLDQLTAGIPGGRAFALVTILSAAALLIVGAQAGFVAGPRVLANMALDSWVPHHFAALSDRLTTQNGILVMGLTSLATLFYTNGDVHKLVVLYSINVFITFSLSLCGMLLHTLRSPARTGRWRDIVLFGVGGALCLTILVVTVVEKFHQGGWLTLVITGGLVAGCFRVKRHYRMVIEKLRELYAQLEKLPDLAVKKAATPPLSRLETTAGVLVAGYGGLGIHTLMNLFRAFPGHFKNVVFLSVGVVDSGEFKGEGSVEALRARTEETLRRYVELAERLGLPATSRYAIGTDVVDELEKLCLATAKEFPRITFFAGKIIFKRESWYQPLLHNETALGLQKRLHWAGHVMVVMPARVQ